MSWLRRLAGFALVPLSLLPLAAIAPVVAPSVAKRIDVMQGVIPTHPATADTLPAGDLLTVTPLTPFVTHGHDRRRARASTKRPHAHRITRRAR